MEMYVVHSIFVYFLFFFGCFSTEINVNDTCHFNDVVGKCIHASLCSAPTSGSNYCGERKGLHTFVCCPLKSFTPDGKEVGDYCTNNGLPGKCVKASHCEKVKSAIEANRYHGLEQCGSRTEVVCCPYEDEVLPPEEEISCDGVKDQCVHANSCIEAKRSIRQKGTHNFQRCGFTKTTELVCCPPDLVDVRSNNMDGESTERNVQINSQQLEEVLNGRLSQGSEINGRFILEKSEHVKRKSERACEFYRSSQCLAANIYNGEVARGGEYPHMAAIKIRYGSVLKTVCGGSLISKRHVLTAAHCFMALDGKRPQIIQLGVTNISDDSHRNVTMYNIESYIIHPKYKRRLQYHDVAIIQLDREVIMNDETHKILPACLNSDEQRPALHENLIVVGWGFTDNMDETGSDILMKAEMFIPKREKCSYQDRRRLPLGITDDLLCALGYENSHGVRGDTCMGDSGGPLQSKDLYNQGCSPATVFGVTSFGMTRCGTDSPAYYTNVYKYLGWIETIIWPEDTDNYD